jgi:dephospho-CoA kinase
LSPTLEKLGMKRIRFGELTDEEVRRRGLEVCEVNERMVREALRRRHGMAAYAKLNIPKILKALKQSDVVIDGLYSWEEYLVLKRKFGDRLSVLAVHSPPSLRYSRLGKRRIRPLTPKQAESRDHAEIENLNKGGPIAMADCSILNDGRPYQQVVRSVKETWRKLKRS